MSVAAMGVSSNGHNKVPQTEEERHQIVTEMTQQLATGSKWFLVGWYTYPGFMWTMKLSMLFLLRRLTADTVASKFVVPITIFTVTTYCIHGIVVATYCMPFHKYWQVYPDPGYRCYPDTLMLYIVCLLFNVLTDLLIASIPIPMMMQVRMSIWRRIGTGILLSASAFIVVASILRVYFSITEPSGPAPAVWACRETLVAAFIVTTPVLVPLIRRSFWTRGPVSSSGPSRSHQITGEDIQLPGGRRGFRKHKAIENDTVFAIEYGDEAENHIGSSSSTEHINRPHNGKGHAK